MGSSKELQESHEEPTSMPRLGASIATWNDDIIWEILQHLSLVPERPEDFHLQQLDDYYKLERLHRRTLASAALTCKAFSEPASQALWAVLPDGLLPLMHTFSNFRATSKTASNPTNYVSSNVTLHSVMINRRSSTDSRRSNPGHRDTAFSTPRCPREVPCVQ